MKLSELLTGSDLRGKSLRSSLFTLIQFGGQNALRLGGNLILTRILFPEAFGIMALVTVVLTGLRMFSDLGFNLSIIQNKRGNDQLFLDTAWVLAILRGFLLFGLTFLLADPVARFYDAPILADLLPIVGLTAVFQGFNSTKLATANRELALGRVTIVDVGSSFIGLLAIISLALAWHSVWALAVGSLVAPFLVMILSHVALPGQNNRFRFDTHAVKDLIGFGKYILLATLAGFIALNADRIVLGKYVSLSDLALYNIAVMFSTLPRTVHYRLFERVLVPLYSRLPPAESVENYRNIARARRPVIAGAIAGAAFFAIFGDALVRVLYDERYHAAGPLLVLMGIAALPGLIFAGYDTMIVTKGHSGRFAASISLAAILRSVALFVLIKQWGLLGAVAAPIFANILFYPALLWFIAPYKGWLPKQDLTFGLLSLVIAGVAIWVNVDAIQEAVSIFGSA